MKLLITKRAKQSIRGLYLQALRKSLNKYVELNSLLSSFDSLMSKKPLVVSYRNDGVIAEWRQKGYSIFETEYNFVRKQDKGNGDVELAFKKAKSKDDYKRKWYFAGLYDSRRRTLYIADAVYAPYVNRPKKELPSAYNFMLAMRSLISRQYNAKVKQLNLPFTNESKIRIGLNEIKQMVCEIISRYYITEALDKKPNGMRPEIYEIINYFDDNPIEFRNLIIQAQEYAKKNPQGRWNNTPTFTQKWFAKWLVNYLTSLGKYGCSLAEARNIVKTIVNRHKEFEECFVDGHVQAKKRNELFSNIKNVISLIKELKKNMEPGELFTRAILVNYLSEHGYGDYTAIYAKIREHDEELSQFFDDYHWFKFKTNRILAYDDETFSQLFEEGQQYAEDNFLVFTENVFCKFLLKKGYGNQNLENKRTATNSLRSLIDTHRNEYKDRFELFDPNNVYCIYTFIDEKEHAVYVGLTCNYDERKNAHMTGNFRGREAHSTVYEHFVKEQGKEVPEPTIVESNLSATKAQVEEGEWVEKYKLEGWNILNKAPTGSVGGIFGKYGRYYKFYKYARDIADSNEETKGKPLTKDFLISLNVFDKDRENLGLKVYGYYLRNRNGRCKNWNISFEERIKSQEYYDKRYNEAWEAYKEACGGVEQPYILYHWLRQNGFHDVYDAYRKWKTNERNYRKKYNFSHWKIKYERKTNDLANNNQPINNNGQ